MPTSPVVSVEQAASTMPVERVEQVVWPLPVEPVEPVDPTGSEGQGVQTVRVALLLRVSCRRAVALALPEPSAAVELQVVAAQLALPVQPVAAGHEAAGALRVPSHLEQPAESEHLEPQEHLVLLERSELQGR